MDEAAYRPMMLASSYRRSMPSVAIELHPPGSNADRRHIFVCSLVSPTCSPRSVRRASWRENTSVTRFPPGVDCWCPGRILVLAGGDRMSVAVDAAAGTLGLGGSHPGGGRLPGADLVIGRLVVSARPPRARSPAFNWASIAGVGTDDSAAVEGRSPLYHPEGSQAEIQSTRRRRLLAGHAGIGK